MMDQDEHRRSVQRQFGATAAGYVSSAGHAKGADLQRMVALSGVTPDSIVLDVATGGGHTALAFAADAGQVVASDLTPEMLAAARAFIAGQGVANVSFAQADAEALPFADASFDIVTCRIAPHHFADLGRAVREFGRVLRPGGRLVLVDNIAPEAPDLDAFINAIERQRDPTHVRAYTVPEWLGFVAAAGLAAEHIEVFHTTRDYREWTVRARVLDDVQQGLDAAFGAASASARRHFAVQTDAQGQVLSFCDDKLLLVARRPE